MAVSFRALIPLAEQGNSVVANFSSLGVQDGDVLVFFARSQASPATDITPPTGWARSGSGTVPADRFLGIFYKAIPSVAAESSLSYTFTGIASGGSSRIIAALGIITGVDLDNFPDGGVRYSTTATVPSDTAGGEPFSVIALVGAEFTAGNSVVPSSVPAGFNAALVAQTAGGSPATVLDNSNTAVSRTGLVISTLLNQSGSLSVPALATTWAGTATDPKSASLIVRTSSIEPPSGLPVKIGDGTTARLTYLDDDGERKTPNSVSLWLPGFNDVDALLAKGGATVSHRGGSLDWPEFSEVAYDRSVRRGYGALEFSCGWTSDLVPFGLGDRYLDAAAGVTGSVDPTTMTWATLAATYQNKLRPVVPGQFQPFYRLEEFLTKYTPHHVVAVDPKFGAGETPQINAMLDICDEIGGPEKIVIKFDSPITGSDLVVAAKARGYVTMNYWGTEIEKLTPTYHTDKWDLIGVRYDADQSMYDAALALGKPVWAAVIPDQAGYDLADVRGASIMMISNPSGVDPVGRS